jgi:hypothetical protein
MATVSYEKDLFRTALALSSGTIGSLINCTRYSVIDAVQHEFVEFCQENEGRFENWVGAWISFKAAYPIEREVTKLLNGGK